MDEQRRWFSIDPYNTNKEIYYGLTFNDFRDLLADFCLAMNMDPGKKETRLLLQKMVEDHAALARKEGFKECAVSADKEHGILMRWK